MKQFQMLMILRKRMTLNTGCNHQTIQPRGSRSISTRSFASDPMTALGLTDVSCMNTLVAAEMRLVLAVIG
jgi:hypothetical protein